MAKEVVKVLFHGDEILLIDIDGKPYLVLKPRTLWRLVRGKHSSGAHRAAEQEN